jgi:hypothetical protein
MQGFAIKDLLRKIADGIYGRGQCLYAKPGMDGHRCKDPEPQPCIYAIDARLRPQSFS